MRNLHASAAKHFLHNLYKS